MKRQDAETKKECRIFVESLDGESYGGESFQEIVSEMRSTAWGGEASAGIRGYMKQVAKRIWDWSNKTIRTDSSEHFLRDLEREGLLRMRVRS